MIGRSCVYRWGCVVLLLALWGAVPSTVRGQDPATDPAATAEAPATETPPVETPTETPTEGTPADAAAPAPAPPPANVGSQPFASWLKILAFVLVYAPWVLVADWVNRSSQQFDLGFMRWNPVIYLPFVGCAFAGLFLPFIVAYPLMWVAFLGPFIAYTVVHNKAVQSHQKVFTSEWFRFTLAAAGSKVGLKMDAHRKADYEKGPPVDLKSMGGDDTQNNANLVLARQSPGYIMVKELVAEIVARRSDRVMLDYGQSGVAVRYYIDGVWHDAEGRERETADVMLAVMKQLANLKPGERRAKQQGKFGAHYDGQKYVLPIETQGVQTGERVTVSLTGGKHVKLLTYEDLGMRDKLSEVWSELMAGDVGLLIFAAMPEGGLTTLYNVSVRETDRLMRDFVAIEDVHHRTPDIENINIVTFDSKAGQTPVSILPSLLRSYPNVIIARDLVDPESAKQLIGQVEDERLIITECHARSAPEALLRMLQKKVPHKEFSQYVTAVLCTRLIRKLCESCRVGYEPSADLLKKLGIPPGKVTALYRVPKGEEIEKPCTVCGGLGYLGRTGLFELLVVNDQLREVLLKQPKLELVTKAARLAGMRTFQEEAILLVAKGVTSLEEAQRILK